MKLCEGNGAEIIEEHTGMLSENRPDFFEMML
jgi:hypothetical protein